MRIRATAAMATVLLCAASWGSAEPKTYTVYGVGAQSCGKWTAEKSELVRGFMNSWVLGYVTALGGVAGARDTDSQAITAWVDNYCREHPLNRLDEAAATLVGELSKPK